MSAAAPISPKVFSENQYYPPTELDLPKLQAMGIMKATHLFVRIIAVDEIEVQAECRLSHFTQMQSKEYSLIQENLICKLDLIVIGINKLKRKLLEKVRQQSSEKMYSEELIKSLWNVVARERDLSQLKLGEQSVPNRDVVIETLVAVMEKEKNWRNAWLPDRDDKYFRTLTRMGIIQAKLVSVYNQGEAGEKAYLYESNYQIGYCDDARIEYLNEPTLAIVHPRQTSKFLLDSIGKPPSPNLVNQFRNVISSKAVYSLFGPNKSSSHHLGDVIFAAAQKASSSLPSSGTGFMSAAATASGSGSQEGASVTTASQSTAPLIPRSFGSSSGSATATASGSGSGGAASSAVPSTSHKKRKRKTDAKKLTLL
jgi:hypothetical protein